MSTGSAVTRVKPEPVDSAYIIGIYSGLLLLAGVVCLVMDFRDERRRVSAVPQWRAGVFAFLLIFWFAYSTAFIGQYLVVALWDASGATSEGWRNALAQATFLGGMLGASLLAVKLIPDAGDFFNKEQEAKSSAAKGVFYFLSALPVMIFFGMGWDAALDLFSWVWQVDAPDTQELVQYFETQAFAPEMLLLVFSGVVLAPLAEEVLFRGILYRSLKAQMPRLPAQAVSAGLFALLHLNAYSFLPLLLLGMLLARAYERTGSLATPIVFHAAFNLNTIVFLRLQALDG